MRDTNWKDTIEYLLHNSKNLSQLPVVKVNESQAKEIIATVCSDFPDVTVKETDVMIDLIRFMDPNTDEFERAIFGKNYVQ